MAGQRLVCSAALLLLSAAAPTTGHAGATGWVRLPLIDQDSRAVTLSQFRGSLLVLNFIFTNCGGTCPTQTSDLAAVQRALPAPLRRHVRFVSVSVDPVTGSPPLLKAFALGRGADLATWSFVTGEPGRIEALAEGLHAGPLPTLTRPGTGHDTDIRLFDAGLVQRQRYAGAPVDGARLAREIAALARMGAAPAAR